MEGQEGKSGDDGLANLRAMFPGFQESTLQNVYGQCGKDVQTACGLLLALSEEDPQLAEPFDVLVGADQASSGNLPSPPPAPSQHPPHPPPAPRGRGGYQAEAAKSAKREGSKGEQVWMNVYHLQEPNTGLSRFTSGVGLGMYHSGVELYGREWSFGGSLEDDPADMEGIFSVIPRTALPHICKRVLLGSTYMGRGEVGELIDSFKTSGSWKARNYSLLKRNCNHFAEAFAQVLNCTFKIPTWVNRAAKLGNVVVPDAVIQWALKQFQQAREAPPTATKNHSSSSNDDQDFQAVRDLPVVASKTETSTSATVGSPVCSDDSELTDMLSFSFELEGGEGSAQGQEEVDELLTNAIALADIVPNVPLSEIREALRANDGSEEATLNYLLTQACGGV